jgi:glycerol-3-phosphate acyltransferase PlsX
MKIAVDAMGGDFAPKAIVEGVMLAQKKTPRN